jgi:hypothetical protein
MAPDNPTLPGPGSDPGSPDRDDSGGAQHLWARDASGPDGQARAGDGTSDSGVADELRRFAQLRDEGIITDEEFAVRKAQLLGAPAERVRAPWSRRRKIVTVGLAVAVVLGGGGTAATMKIKHDHDVSEKREAAERAHLAAVERARLARERKQRDAEEAAAAQREADHLEITMRRILVRDLRKSISKDFRGRVADGYLDGPILGTTCNPISGGAEDLEETTGKFECLVANERLGGDQVRGYSVDATVNYTKGSYTWQMSLG